MWNDSLSLLASGLAFVGPATNLESLADDLGRAGWRVGICTIGEGTTKASLLESIAVSLNFPDWTGRNLDATYDSLTDLSWLDEQQVALIIDSAAAQPSAVEGWQQIRQVLLDAAAWWHPLERSFVTIVR